MSDFPQTREEFDAYKARLEAAGLTVLTKWRRGLKTIRLGDIVLSEPEPETTVVTLPELARLPGNWRSNRCPSVMPGPPLADGGQYQCELGTGHGFAHCFAGIRWTEDGR